MRSLGMDFGEKRIGLALSDPRGEYALPFTTLTRHNDPSAVSRIAEIVRQEEVLVLVLGEPLNLDGTRGPAAERVRRFGAKVETATGLPVTFVNEALTSVEAEAQLRARGLDPAKHPERVDALAAQILLQEVLDRRGRGA